MTDHQPLIDRLEALVDRSNHPDWEDVVRRAEEPAQAAGPVLAGRSKRSRFARRLVPVFALAATALAIGLIAPWRHGPSIVDRALAAIGNGPVIHAVLRMKTGFTFIDLATGKETPQLETIEIWYDGERRYEHWKGRVDNGPRFDTLETPTGFTNELGRFPATTRLRPKLDPGLAGFVGYRSALENGTARVVGKGTVNGHDVTWIEIPVTKQWTDRVAVDNGSSLPVRIEEINRVAGPVGGFDVLSIETLQEGDGNFTPPKIGPRREVWEPGKGIPVSSSEAATALPGALWNGESASGLSLSKVFRVPLTTGPGTASGLAPESATGITLKYGKVSPGSAESSGTAFIRLEETAQSPPTYWWPEQGELLPTGTMLFTGAFTEPGYNGLLVKNGIYVHIDASSRDLLLAAARSLKPIRPPASPTGN
ncbi:MAG: hypothetical protein ABSB96_03660 [Gaiellaceae bacterium]